MTEIHIHIHPAGDDPEKLKQALTLVTNSREFNRKRVVKLEDELARYQKAHVCTDGCKPDAHVAFTGNQLVKDLRAEVEEKDRQIDALEAEVTRLKRTDEKHFDPSAAAEVLAENYARSRERVVELEAKVARLEPEVARLKGTVASDAGTIESLRDRCTDAESERDTALNLSKDRETRINALENRIVNLTEDRRREKDRADANRDWAQRAEDRAHAERQGQVDLATRIEKAAQILAAPDVTKTREEIVTNKGAVLADTIGAALKALKSAPATEE